MIHGIVRKIKLQLGDAPLHEKRPCRRPGVRPQEAGTGGKPKKKEKKNKFQEGKK